MNENESAAVSRVSRVSRVGPARVGAVLRSTSKQYNYLAIKISILHKSNHSESDAPYAAGSFMIHGRTAYIVQERRRAHASTAAPRTPARGEGASTAAASRT